MGSFQGPAGRHKTGDCERSLSHRSCASSAAHGSAQPDFNDTATRQLSHPFSRRDASPNEQRSRVHRSEQGSWRVEPGTAAVDRAAQQRTGRTLSFPCRNVRDEEVTHVLWNHASPQFWVRLIASITPCTCAGSNKSRPSQRQDARRPRLPPAPLSEGAEAKLRPYLGRFHPLSHPAGRAPFLTCRVLRPR